MKNRTKQALIKLVKVNEARHGVITPKFRVSFPQVFEPTSFQDEDPKFKLDMIFESKEDFKRAYTGKKKQTVSLANAVKNAKIDQWGPDKAKWPYMENKVFKDGNDRTNPDGDIYDGYEDKVFISASSGEKYPPKVIGLDGKPLDENSFYGGCYAIAYLIARPYSVGKNHGVRLILQQIQKVDDGERFGGVAQDVFDYSEGNLDELEDNDGDDW